MESIEDSFLASIRDDRHDDQPRLIYADFLEESGDVMGEFIRLQCLGPHSQSRRERKSAASKAQQMVARYRRQWIGSHYQEHSHLVRFHRGFPEEAIVSEDVFARDRGRSILRTKMLLDLTIRNTNGFGRYCDAVTESFECADYPAQLDSLNLQGIGLAISHVRKLARNQNLRRLRRLSLRWNPAINADCLTAISESVFADRLRVLDLEGVYANPPMIEVCLNSDVLARLDILVLTIPNHAKFAKFRRLLRERFGERVYLRGDR